MEIEIEILSYTEDDFKWSSTCTATVNIGGVDSDFAGIGESGNIENDYVGSRQMAEKIAKSDLVRQITTEKRIRETHESRTETITI